MSNAGSLVAAFSEEQVARLTGLSVHQLRYWDRTDFFRPTYGNGDFRSAFGRVYGFQDIVALRVLAVLRRQYNVSVQHLRQVKEKLTQPGRSTWTGVKLYVLSKKVVWVEPGTGAPQEVASGQYVFETIDLEAVANQTKGDVKGLTARGEHNHGVIEKRRSVSHSAPVIAGTRISVRAIQRFAEAGYTTPQIIEEYPDLTEADVRAALEYKNVA